MSHSKNSSALLSLAEFLKTLTEWQRSELIGLPKEGIKCLVNHWYNLTRFPILGSFCNATWDDIYCWPPTLAGQNVTRPCSEVMKNDPDIPNPEEVEGDAYRVCNADAIWEWEGWTNYNQCMAGIPDYPPVTVTPGPDILVLNTVRYTLFIGSVLSFICLTVSLFIFLYFKTLRCDRITVQIHLMLALALRFFLLIIIAEPFVFQRSNHYRTVDWTCKVVMATQLYGTVASVSWMFVQGHYLHSRVTTNVFDRGTPFKLYFCVGWGIPLMLICGWTAMMETFHPVHCWKNYGEQPYIWMIVGPMIAALSVNFLFLINIMRILLTKIQLATISSDSTQFRRAAKATALLFPLLGINNLLFLYNPGGSYEAAYMITNTVFQSSQGILVSIFYCFLSKEVRDAIRREYCRYTAKKTTANTRTVHQRIKSSRRSSYWNQTVVTNSVFGDTPSTTTTVCQVSTFSSRASTFITRMKSPRRSAAANSTAATKNTPADLKENGNMETAAPRVAEEEDLSSSSQENIEFFAPKPYVTVAYCCHARGGCKLIGESIEDAKSLSEENSNTSEAALQILSLGYSQAFPHFDSSESDEGSFPTAPSTLHMNRGCQGRSESGNTFSESASRRPQFV